MMGVFRVTCLDHAGVPRWSRAVHNALTDAGYALLLDAALSGSGYVATNYVGLIGAVTSGVDSGDTMASHAGWTEGTFVAARRAPTWNAASAGDKDTAPLDFTCTGIGTVKGLFLVASAPGGGNAASATLGNTGGVLYSAGAMVEGDLGPVAIDETVRVTYVTGLNA